MFAEKRLNEIVEIVKKKKRVSNQELCDTLYCSTSTLRRDLIKLENQNIIRRVAGGVILNINQNSEPSSTFRETNNKREKKYLCELAKDFIGPGMCIFLDSSSTVQQIVPIIKDIPNLIVITNGLQTAADLSDANADSIKSFFIGGEIKKNSKSVVGSEFAQNFLSQFRIDLAIFSALGVDLEGVYEASLSQATTKQEVLKKAKQKLLLVDNSKFGSTHFFKISDFENYDAIITNKSPSSSYVNMFDTKKVDWLC